MLLDERDPALSMKEKMDDGREAERGRETVREVGEPVGDARGELTGAAACEVGARVDWERDEVMRLEEAERGVD